MELFNVKYFLLKFYLIYELNEVLKFNVFI